MCDALTHISRLYIVILLAGPRRQTWRRSSLSEITPCYFIYQISSSFVLYLPPCTYYIYILALHLVDIKSHTLIWHHECVCKIWFGQIVFYFFIYSKPCIYITYRSSHLNWLIFIPYINFISGTRVPNFIWFRQATFDFYCSGHDAFITYVSLYWAKEVSRCTGTRNMTAFFIERRKVVAHCTVTLCTYCVLLHSLWPVAL